MAKPKKKRRWLRRLITWLVLLTVAAGAFALFVLPTWQAEATTTYVKYTASRGTISNALSFSGSGSVVNNETLTAGAAATVRTVYVAEGDQVEILSGVFEGKTTGTPISMIVWNRDQRSRDYSEIAE